MAVLIGSEIRDTRSSIREEIEAANQVASQLLGRLAVIYTREGGPEVVQQFLQQLGRVRANDIVLRSPAGEQLYRSPPPTYKAGREAPAWFAHLLSPHQPRHIFPLPGGFSLVVEAQTSRSILDAWDDLTRLLAIAAIMLVLVNGLAFWLVDRALAPFPVIAKGLERVQRGELSFRLPPLPGAEARSIGAAFNRMAQSVEDNVQAERRAREAQARLEERREMAKLVEQRVDEERRLIAHELHDEFGQSVTAIRSLALVIANQAKEPAMGDTARLISNEAARLYDAMHGLIPRLMPPELDTLSLAETLEGLVRDWQRRFPTVALSLRHTLAGDLGPSVTLAIYRVVQEGLINALRHAQASHVNINVESDAERIVVSVTDDGVGLPQEWARPGHFGLRGLSERVEHLGGVFKVRNREPRGASLNAEIPLTAAT
jgi:two-component system, NarL family, sensor histidine kinase UhpB